ncbi:DUF6484 domain-containing protein [Diaphorobacter caeni]|uniref:DUF6484 domain-containing protein n=1 Tax=Diaphorobacter caeni TaxID=2784387 RepID=UPI00188DD645|nr:DUF6484 domain-containing protein [Diaphorobacter caeni]MBF5005293.1 hypothetical protein [Diaphorobacter caeni]
MTTSHLARGVAREQSADAAPIDELLNRARTSNSTDAGTRDRIEGILLGTLQNFDVNGVPLVDIAYLGTESVAARSLVALSHQDTGKTLALGFESGDARFPIILGIMHTSGAAVQIRGNGVSVETDQGRVLVEAQEELELRCGEAVILLQSDGRITLRGEYITSHADAGQRIRGGSVQIN